MRYHRQNLLVDQPLTALTAQSPAEQGLIRLWDRQVQWNVVPVKALDTVDKPLSPQQILPIGFTKQDDGGHVSPLQESCLRLVRQVWAEPEPSRRCPPPIAHAPA